MRVCDSKPHPRSGTACVVWRVAGEQSAWQADVAVMRRCRVDARFRSGCAVMGNVQVSIPRLQCSFPMACCAMALVLARESVIAVGGNGTRKAPCSLCISCVLWQRANSRLMLEAGAGA